MGSTGMSQRGVAAVVFAGALVAMVAMVGLVIDVGYAFLKQSRLQVAADACALAGVKQLDDTRAGLRRAEAAGRTVAEINLQGSLRPAEYQARSITVSFNDRLVTAFDTGNAAVRTSDHVRCTVEGPNTWVSGLLGLSSYRVVAQATAKMDSAAAVCAIPLAVCAKEIAQTTAGAKSCKCDNGYSNGTFTKAFCENPSNFLSDGSCNSSCLTKVSGKECKTVPGPSTTNYIIDNSDASKPYGLTPGQWVSRPRDTSVIGPYTAGVTGSFNWANISGVGGASALKDALAGPGFCEIDPTNASANIDTEIGNPGTISSMADAWNTRLGLYKSQVCNTADSKRNAGKTLGSEPDYTGHPFDPAKYPADANGVRNVYSRTTNCPTGLPCNYLDAKENNVAYPGASNQCFFDAADLGLFGKDRRLVALPVVQCSQWSGGGSQQTRIAGWVCGLIVREFPSTGSGSLDIEVLGAVNEPGSPCGQVGVAAKNSIAGKVATLVE
jgi:Flp pilus assembly protein TadG